MWRRAPNTFDCRPGRPVQTRAEGNLPIPPSNLSTLHMWSVPLAWRDNLPIEQRLEDSRHLYGSM